MGVFIQPVHSEDDSGSQEVWLLFHKLPRGFLVGVHGPLYVVGAAVQLVRLVAIENSPEESHPKGELD